jgi:hypothetical protein
MTFSTLKEATPTASTNLSDQITRGTSAEAQQQIDNDKTADLYRGT